MKLCRSPRCDRGGRLYASVHEPRDVATRSASSSAPHRDRRIAREEAIPIRSASTESFTLWDTSSTPFVYTRRQGFTLVELLVSMTITAVMLGLLAILFNNIAGVVGHMSDTTRAYDDVRSSVQMMGRELASTLLRTEKNRWLNFRVEERTGPRGKRVIVYATVPDESLGSTLHMSFINHVVYYWEEADHAVYRVTYNTRDDNALLLATASDADNLNANANLNRLTAMTLAYRQSSPYGWTTDARITDQMNQPIDQAIMRDVYYFRVKSYEASPSEGGSPRVTWNKSDALPRLVELDIGIAHGADADRVSYVLETTGNLQEASKNMQRFTYAFPMSNYGTKVATGL